jgi:hypothetical protein
MTHPVKSVSSILVSSNDGTIRIYANDNLKISPKPQVFFADRFVRSEMSNPKGVKFPTILENIKIYCQVDYVCTLDGIHYIVGITSNSIYN